MSKVTIDMDGISTTVEVNGETTEDCIKQAFAKLYPEKTENHRFEYTVITKFEEPMDVEKFKRKLAQSINKDSLMRGMK